MNFGKLTKIQENTLEKQKVKKKESYICIFVLITRIIEQFLSLQFFKNHFFSSMKSEICSFA